VKDKDTDQIKEFDDFDDAGSSAPTVPGSCAQGFIFFILTKMIGSRHQREEM